MHKPRQTIYNKFKATKLHAITSLKIAELWPKKKKDYCEEQTLNIL